MIPEKRNNLPTTRLAYSGLGQQTEIRATVASNSRQRQGSSSQQVTGEGPMANLSMDGLVKAIESRVSQVKVCEQTLREAEQAVKDLEGVNLEDMTEEEHAQNDTVRLQYNNARIIFEEETQQLMSLKAELALREKESLLRRARESGNAMALGKANSKASGSLASSATQRRRQVEINLKRSKSRLQHECDMNTAAIDDKINSLKIKLNSCAGTPEEEDIKLKLEQLELEKSSLLKRVELQKKHAEEEATLDIEEIDLEEEERNASDDDVGATAKIPDTWEGTDYPPADRHNTSHQEAQSHFHGSRQGVHSDDEYDGYYDHLNREPQGVEFHNSGRSHHREQQSSLPERVTVKRDSSSAEDKDSMMMKVLQTQLELMRKPPAQKEWEPKDLPLFNGKAEDWPIFKNEFNRTTPAGKVNSSQNAIRLRKALKGVAMDAVYGLLNDPANITRIMTTLEESFGRNELVIRALVEKAEQCKPPDINKHESFVTFGRTVQHLVETVKSMKEDSYLNDMSLLDKLVGKLPAQYSMEWMMFLESKKDIKKNLASFGDWMEIRLRLAVQLVKPVIREDDSRDKRNRTRGSASINVTTSEDSFKSGDKDSCLCCGKGSHKLKNCFTFKKESLDNKNRLVREKGLCFRCLGSGHNKKDCSSNQLCGIDDCKSAHHPLLHTTGKSWKSKTPDADRSQGRDSGSKENVAADEAGDKTSSHVGAVQSTSSKPLSIVKIKVKGRSGTRKVYALLDSGADTTIIESSLAKKLGITGPRIAHKCRGIGGKLIEQEVESVGFKVSGNYRTAKEFEIVKAVTMEDMGLAHYTQNATEAKKKWPYLRRAKLEDFEGVKPEVIIGEDNPFITAHRELLQGSVHDPMAKRTLLGWVLAGRKVSSVDGESNINVMTSEEGEQLDTVLKSCFSLDTFGIYPQTTEGSIEDRRALEIMERTVKRVGKSWECGLLWRDESVKFPETRKEAVTRLISNERRMKREPVFGEMYTNKLKEYEEKEYIRELTSTEARVTTDKTLYIPHFGVFNVNKPGKLRLVFDAASRNGGVSLNDHLLPGPDLIRPLTSVLMNFRIHNVVINGDIEDMFHRVMVKKEDRESQRFLWRDIRDGEDAKIKTYMMNVLIFGACSSPASAIYVKNHNAKDFQEEYPEAVRVIQEDFYCDDCLAGARTVPEAIKLRQEITDINMAGNFYIRKWLSNSKEVMESIPEQDRAAGVKCFGDKTELPTERILGLWWNPEADVFTFTTNFKKLDPTLLEGRRPTKREACSLIMSIFDPLGFVANFRIKGLILLQRTCRTGINWDDELTDDIYVEWKIWVNNLKETANVKVPRCYCYDIHLAMNVQLHTLVDSSEEACAAICFLRVKVGENVNVSFVAAKTKVAPTKKLTIPRLELLAAVMGACLADTVMNELRISINQRYFWSDSKTVLMWIRTETLRYKEFVANRINRIHLLSNVSEWRWIPTDLNVADQGTRLKSVISLTEDSSWLCGPEFLRLEPDAWPVEKKNEKLPEDESEIRKSSLYVVSSGDDSPNCGQAVVKMARFSSFSRMRRAQAAVEKAAKYWIQRARKEKAEAPWSLPDGVKLPKMKPDELPGKYMARVGKFLHVNLMGNLHSKDLEKAEVSLARKVQHDAFEEDLKSIARGKLNKSSRIWKLSPYVENGLIRMKGRISAANLPMDQVDLIILPAQHKFTELLVMREHERNAHQGHSSVLSNIRRRYWILEGRAAVRRVVHKCQSCRIFAAKPIIPKMGDLPYYRVSSGKPPFYYTGLDLYGPVEVVVGRHHEKRWVCVFTCMVTRAIHLEVVYGLSTDETMMALSRFIDTRGRPGHLYSDNGTNFVGAKKELKNNWDAVDWEAVMANDKFQEIQWKFSPPCSPHFGGAWERMVQAVKRILKRTLHEKFPKDQTLLTMLKGAENIVNSRPLTYVSSDPGDEAALTPNHFLRGFADMGPGIPGEYGKDDELFRAQWRRAQYFLDEFWNIWNKEVLPEMLRRDKWHLDVEPIKQGELVLMVDDQSPRNTWVKAVVTEVSPGKDGQVRVVRVMTVDPSSGRKTTYKRGVDKICPLGLFVENHSNDFGGRNVETKG